FPILLEFLSGRLYRSLLFGPKIFQDKEVEAMKVLLEAPHITAANYLLRHVLSYCKILSPNARRLRFRQSVCMHYFSVCDLSRLESKATVSKSKFCQMNDNRSLPNKFDPADCL